MFLVSSHIREWLNPARYKKPTYQGVLNSDSTHLSEQQLYQACQFLGFSKDEREFMQLLRRYQRCDVRQIESEWKNDIEAFRCKMMETDKFLNVSSHSPSSEDKLMIEYYLNPTMILTHVFLTIEEYRTSPRKIMQFLGIDETGFNTILSKLESMELIQLTKHGYISKSCKSHLQKNSPLYPHFRTLQRLKSIEQMNQLSNDQLYSFSVVFSSNPKVRQKIQKKVLELIAEVEKDVDQKSEEQVYQLNIDFFDWSD